MKRTMKRAIRATLLAALMAMALGGICDTAASAVVFTPAADTYVYGGNPASTAGGADTRLLLKHDGTVTNSRKTWIRHGWSRAGRVFDATLDLTFVDTGIGGLDATGLAMSWEFDLFGLTDDSGDAWAEATTHWNNAPGNDTASGNGVLASKATSLGTFAVTGKGVGTHTLSSPALTQFLHQDDNCDTTLILVRNTLGTGSNNYAHGIASKEHATSSPATLSIVEHNRLVNGEFEGAGGAFSTAGWYNGSGVAVAHAPIVAGSSAAAFMRSSVRSALTQSIPTAGPDWLYDVYFATENGGGGASDRGLNAYLVYSGGQINMRVNGQGILQVYDQGLGWQNLTAAGAVQFSIDADNSGDFSSDGDTLNVYHLRFLGHDFGTPAAAYDVLLSAANECALSPLAAGTGIQYFQSLGPYVSSRSGLTSVQFHTSNISQLGKGDFVVDAVYLYVPEPATLSLLGLGALALVRRRRAR